MRDRLGKRHSVDFESRGKHENVGARIEGRETFRGDRAGDGDNGPRD